MNKRVLPWNFSRSAAGQLAFGIRSLLKAASWYEQQSSQGSWHRLTREINTNISDFTK